jgi:hypothetical protein
MEKFSKKAAAVLNDEGLQVINTKVWNGIQDAKRLRCELYWLDEHEEPITVEVPLYAVHQAYKKVGHGCVINLVCPNGAFIPSAVDIDKDGTIGLDLPYEPFIREDRFNVNASCDFNVIVTRRELVAVEVDILKAID